MATAAQQTDLGAHLQSGIRDNRHRRHAHAEQAMRDIDEMCKTVRLGGRKFTREEMNER